jgi:hypothetical protein
LTTTLSMCVVVVVVVGYNGLRFAGVDWKKAARRQLTPPYVPAVRDDGDTSNFDAYPEDKDPLTVPGPDPYRDVFADF